MKLLPLVLAMAHNTAWKRPTQLAIKLPDCFPASHAVHLSSDTILILNDYKDAERRSAEGDGSPVVSLPKAEVESKATMTAKPSARLRRGEILLSHTKEMI